MTAAPASRRSDVYEPRILVVDDEASIRDSIARYLTARGFEVSSAASYNAALDLLKTSRFGTLLCDVRLPGASGIELVPEALRHDRDLAILMLTGLNDANAATEALSAGAVDYLLKPIELDRLENAIARALQRRRDRLDRRRADEPMREQLAVRAAELERERRMLHEQILGLLETVITLSEARSPHHAGHSQRVSELSGAIAVAMGLDAATVSRVQTAARLHDIGIVALAETILLKPDPLTTEEHGAVRQHVRIGLQMLAPMPQFADVLPYVRDHHERWDGLGYPSGLKGEDISIGGRILAVADAYVAVTAGRAYFNALGAADAVSYLALQSKTRFDPAVFRALEQVVNGRGG